MAAPREPPWTTHEKNALLAEIIKVNAPNPQVLLNVINSMNMSPRLEEVPLPQGRSLNSCRNAFDALRRESTVATVTSGPMGFQASSPMSAPLMPGKRPFFSESGPMQPGRQLAPKPPTSAPYGSGASQIGQPPPQKKKRGRPTKAEAQAKAAEAQGGGAESSSLARPQIAAAPMATPLAVQPPELPRQSRLPLPVQTPVEERRQSQPAVSRMNISSMLAATPTGPGSASHSSSSSGKRRRGRSTRSEPEPLVGATGTEPFPEYESPYPRIGGDDVDSPARAAMARRREEPRAAEEQQQQAGGQQQEQQRQQQQQQQPTTGYPPHQQQRGGPQQQQQQQQ